MCPHTIRKCPVEMSAPARSSGCSSDRCRQRTGPRRVDSWAPCALRSPSKAPMNRQPGSRWGCAEPGFVPSRIRALHMPRKLDYGMWTMECGLWNVDYGMWTLATAQSTSSVGNGVHDRPTVQSPARCLAGGAHPRATCAAPTTAEFVLTARGSCRRRSVASRPRRDR
jgi:hypothetical protein